MEKSTKLFIDINQTVTDIYICNLDKIAYTSVGFLYYKRKKFFLFGDVVKVKVFKYGSPMKDSEEEAKKSVSNKLDNVLFDLENRILHIELEKYFITDCPTASNLIGKVYYNKVNFLTNKIVKKVLYKIKVNNPIISDVEKLLTDLKHLSPIS